MTQIKSIMNTRRAYLLLCIVILLWGANWPIMKIGIEHMPPFWFAAIRVLLGSVCLFALLAVKGNISLPSRADLPILISVGFLQIGLGLGLIHLALLNIDTGRSAILAYTTPLWVAPLALLFLGERPGTIKIFGLLTGLAGIGVLFNPATIKSMDTAHLYGNGFLILSAISLAIVIVHIRSHSLKTPALQLMPWQLLLGSIILGLTALFIEGIPEPKLSMTTFAILAYNGPIASAFCFWAFFTVMRTLPATSTALGSLGVPVVGMLSSAWVLNEPLTWVKVTGLILISGGVALLIFNDLGKQILRSLGNRLRDA